MGGVTADPHRGRCWWTEIERDVPPEHLGWFALLDWAVYHAPGWQLWQEFRKSLVGQPMSLRAHRISEWWSEAQEPHYNPTPGLDVEDPACWVDEDGPEQLADIVRCVNVLRSLRGQFSANPELPALLARLNPELEKRWTHGRLGTKGS